MFVRAKRRFKDGKEHRYWSVVENCRSPDGRVVQRQVLYLGEINDSQRAAWCRSIEVLCGESGPKPVTLFPADREAPELACEVVRIELKTLRLRRARQWGACWLALVLWARLDLDRFWRPRLPPSRRGTRWLDVLKTLVCHQLIDPGSEWRLHRHWYALAQSGTRVLKERGMRRRRLKKLWRRLHELRGQSLKRDELLLKLGAAKKEAGRAWHLVDIGLPKAREAVTAGTFTFSPRRERLRRARRREGRYLPRSNLTGEDPATLWRYYMRLSEIEQAFKELKHDLAIRPIFHQREDRIEAHIFVAFIAYCPHVTLKNLARPRAPGLTPRAILEKFSTMQMVDAHLPTTDGRHLVLPRRTDPTRDRQLLLHQLNMKLPEQPPPRISAWIIVEATIPHGTAVVPTFRILEQKINKLHAPKRRVVEVGVGSEHIERLLANPAFVGLVALNGARVVGALAAYELSKFEQERSEFYIYDLPVDEVYRHQGIATALIAATRTIARQRGGWVVMVQADRGDDPAIALYSGLGAREEILHFDIPAQ